MNGSIGNLLVAAHGLRLGALVTTVDAGRLDREIQDLLGTPDQAEIARVIPISYPALTARAETAQSGGGGAPPGHLPSWPPGEDVELVGSAGR
jgi:hypothetical protein